MIVWILASLLLNPWFAGAQELGSLDTSNAETLELSLSITADTELLFNHVNPLIFTLTSPWGEFTSLATGELFSEDPKVYWQSLNPVVWNLPLSSIQAFVAKNSLRLLDIKLVPKINHGKGNKMST